MLLKMLVHDKDSATVVAEQKSKTERGHLGV